MHKEADNHRMTNMHEIECILIGIYESLVKRMETDGNYIK
jgi:hypothetical protein